MKFNIPTSLFVLTLTLVIASMPTQANAHGGATLTFSATSTTEGKPPYMVDIDFAEAAIVADSFGRFDFNLFTDASRQKPVKYTDLWVRIEQKEGDRRGKTLYAGSVAKASFGGTGFGFLFPKGGKYTLSVRYNDANKDELGDTVAEAEFSLDVLRGYDEDTFKFGSMEFWVGLIAGAFILMILAVPLLMKRT